MAAVVTITQFVAFKYFYPYANYIHNDSFVYLEMAVKHVDIGPLMPGYSRFLSLFGGLTKSDIALVAVQYLMVQSSALFLLFTLFYFYRPVKVVQVILLCFMMLNPLFLHLSNLISSDAFFLALSLTWFSLLLWIMHRPSNHLTVCHILVLFVAFTVRYNALVYPAIATLAFLLSGQSLRKKIYSIGAIILLCGIFIFYTGSKYRVLTGAWQYAPLGGWLIASNALHTYRYVDSAARKPVPIKFKALDNVMRGYFDSSRRSDSNLPMDLTLFMYPPDLFLKKYNDLRFKDDITANDLTKWASAAPLYADYGIYIIRQYPLLYVRYLLWPNINSYYVPSVGSLANYNGGTDSVAPITQIWFGYKNSKVKTRARDMAIRALDGYPIYSGAINVVMLCCLLCFLLLGGFRSNMLFRKAVLLACTIWLLNAGLTIFSVKAALRFQSFSIVIATIFALLVIDWLWKMGVNDENSDRPSKKGVRRPESKAPLTAN